MNTIEMNVQHIAARRPRRPRIRRLAVGLLTAALVMALPAHVQADPLWGVDEDQGQLFSLNLDTFAVTDYGNLQYDTGSGLADIGEHIEAFTIDATGSTAYFAVNADVGGFGEPVLMSMDITGATTTGPNVANILGTIDVGFNHAEDNITGLSFDQNGALFALLRNNDANDVDRLVVIDRNNGSVVENRGDIFSSLLGESATSAEDMVFDAAGNLYVTDNFDDHLYQIDPATGNILAVIDGDQKGGLGDGTLKLEALAFDPLNNFLLAADDAQDRLVLVSLADGGNTMLADLGGAGLSDVEGFAWNPGGVPEPAPMVITLLGMVLIAARRPRRPRESDLAVA